MRRRFGRRRQRDQADDGRSPIDASWLERIVSPGLVPLSALEPFEVDGVPNTLCRLGSGEPESGGRCIVSYSPHSASEALLGLVAALQRYTVELYDKIQAESGRDCGIHMTGGLQLADTPERMDYLRMAHARGQYLGMETELVSPEEAHELVPFLDPSYFVGAMYDLDSGAVTMVETNPGAD